jgi:hypothetical protein
MCKNETNQVSNLKNKIKNSGDKMNKRLVVICIFFLILPLLGIILQIFGGHILLTKWSYLNVLFSVLFSIAFMKGSFNISKIFAGILFLSILLQEIIPMFSVIEFDVSSIVLSMTGILYKLIISILVYYFLLKPAFTKIKKSGFT